MQNQKIKLTSKQKSIIVGLLLGDGHLETQNNGQTYRLKVEHSINQYDYLEWLYLNLKNIIPGKIYSKTKDNRKYVGFRTYSLGELRFYGQQFYVNKNKRIPPLISKMMNNLVLAIWFMDDGSIKSLKHKTYIIHSLGFKRKELSLMLDVLENKFGIKASLHKQKGKYWRVYIKSESKYDFEKIIKPIVSTFDSMKHKLVTIMPKK